MLRPAGSGFRSSAEPVTVRCRTGQAPGPGRVPALGGRAHRRPGCGRCATWGRSLPRPGHRCHAPGRWRTAPPGSPCGSSPEMRCLGSVVRRTAIKITASAALAPAQAVPRPFSPLRPHRQTRRGLNRSAACQSYRLVQVWWYMSVPVPRAAVYTWAMGMLVAAAGIAEPTRADPATPSARMAGMMKARPMRMIPPSDCRGQRAGRPAGGLHWSNQWRYCHYLCPVSDHYAFCYRKKAAIHLAPVPA